MVEIVNKKPTTLKALEKLTKIQELRPYLGMSQLGHECERYLWYTFRWCYVEETPARVVRLFRRGDREEDVIIEELKRVGIDVKYQQFEVTACHGHVKGHCDGVAFNVIEAPKTPHLSEFKTMNLKAFKEIKKEGLKKSKPVYWSQCQLYMGEMKLTRTLFVAVCKDTDEWYIERVYYDKEAHERLIERGCAIILSDGPPAKKFKSTWWKCKWCAAKEICHEGFPVRESCRVCEHGDIYAEGEWKCGALLEGTFSLHPEQQKLGCGNFSLMPQLLQGSDRL